MSTVLGVLVAVYGGSIAIIAGGGLVWLVSSRMRGETAKNLETD